MPRKKTVPTEPQPDPPAEITEATVEPAPNPIEQQPPDILNGSTPPGEDLETPSVPSETDAETEVASTEASEDAEEPSYDDAKSITKRLLTDFENGEIGEIYLIYTFFKNTVSHIPTMIKVLPAEVQEEAGEEDAKAQLTPMNFEPEAEEAISLLVPKYISSILYGAFVEAVASENGARMQAMDSATSNAEEMIDDLELKYNRARQGAITQELTEIIAGAEAIG